MFDPTAVGGAYRGTERRERRDCICVYYVSACVFSDAKDRLKLGPSSLRLFTDRVLIDSEIFAVYICSATQTSIKRRPSSSLLLCQQFIDSSVNFSIFFPPLVPENVRLVCPFPDVNLPVLCPESEVLFSLLKISTDTAALSGKIAASCQR